MTTPVVEGKASFALRGHNPDVLSCIANLSNDEVFTPPELANRMLDTVAEAWSEAHDGASIWEDPDVNFLDPFTKSGVFLREITRRLTDGLAEQLPNLEERVDHILTRQVYGIGITRLTALLARRSVYCSKDATGEHSIAKSFDRDWGNIWFERTEHTWAGGKCAYCGASESAYGRGDELETHAYAFIHTTDIKARLARMFGADMQFDVIIGNPPYQLGSDGGTRDMPIYQHFVEQAKKLEPRLLAMVIPARWMAAGLGLGDFRRSMLADRSLRVLVDYPVAKQVFSGVEIKGGVCYFLRDDSHDGDCEVTMIRGDETIGPLARDFREHDVFVRDARAISILDKVISRGESSMSMIMSARTAFGLYSNYKGYRMTAQPGDVAYYATGSKGRFVGYVSPADVPVNRQQIDTWKAMVPKAGSDGGQKLPDIVLGRPWIAERPSVCSQSFLFVPTDTRLAAESVVSYFRTRFLRFLVGLRKITQDTTASSYTWVPQQVWDHHWTDKELYAKYGITDDEIAFIESMVRPMELGDAED
jgi:site-specific DNA-methyltransferase (adenine-specific)